VSGTIDPRTYLDGSGRRHVWVAERMGVDASYLSHLLAGRRNWTPALQCRFANAVGMDARAFRFAQVATSGVADSCAPCSVAVEAATTRPDAREGAVEYSATRTATTGR
jgi:transcriptional regulator with XRE-family HTH domain